MKESYSVLAEFSVVPLGLGETSISRYVALAIKSIGKVEGLAIEVTPMGTILAAENLDPILEAVKNAHESLVAKGVLRVLSSLKIDDRRDKKRTMKEKVKAVEKHLKNQ